MGTKRAPFHRGRQTFRENLSLIKQARGDNLLAAHRLSALYFAAIPDVRSPGYFNEFHGNLIRQYTVEINRRVARPAA